MNIWCKIIFICWLNIISVFIAAQTETAYQDYDDDESDSVLTINVTCNPEQKIEHVEQNIYVRQTETPDCSVEIQKQVAPKSNKPNVLSRATEFLGFLIVCASAVLLVPPSHQKPYIFGTHMPTGPCPY